MGVGAYCFELIVCVVYILQQSAQVKGKNVVTLLKVVAYSTAANVYCLRGRLYALLHIEQAWHERMLRLLRLAIQSFAVQ